MSFIKSKPSKNGKHFIPKNKNKYKGSYPIWVRSGLEDKFCSLLDSESKIISWASEPVGIPYLHQGNRHTYYPDFFAEVLFPTGEIQKWLIELKPDSQTKPPIITKGKSRKTVLTEKLTWEKNQSKWKAARTYCDKMGYTWKIITEKQVFKK